MANRSLFARLFGVHSPAPTTANEAGGPAYELTAEQALAQFAATGCLNATFYADARTQLQDVLALAADCAPEFVAKVAVFAREQGAMKDMPALLCAHLATRDGAWLERAFARAIDNGKQLRSFVQIVRSGVTGRKSLGTQPRRLVRQWLAARSDEQLFAASIGNAPSLADVIRMVHPKPATPARDNLHRYLLGKPFDPDLLPAAAAQLEWCKLGLAEPPDVSFLLLTSLPLTAEHWRQIALRASWTTLRMNLNTFLRHGVFACAETTQALAARLACADDIRRSNAFPYQIMTTLQNLTDDVPIVLRDALAAALETATAAVPALPGRVVVALDVSGSMASPVTGHRQGATTKTRCLDVAALFAASILRRNRAATVMPFHDRVVDVTVDADATIATTAKRLAELPSGGTDCSVVLAALNRRGALVDTVVFVSDNQSWIDADAHGVATGMLVEWRKLKRRCPAARLVCIDLQPYRTVQAPVADDVVHVGGFADTVFEVLRAVATGEAAPDLWVDRIRKVAV